MNSSEERIWNPLRRFGRRRFCRWSAASLAALGFGVPAPFHRTIGTALAGEPAAVDPAGRRKKILFIFLRGGLDGVQAVIPYGDPGISGRAPTFEEARPQLRPDRARTHDLNGFAHFYPTVDESGDGAPRLADIFHGRLDERGPQLAVLHRVGYAEQNRSHFSSQQFWENGLPGETTREDGVFNRYLTAYPDPANPMRAATLSGNQVVLMKGPTLVPVLRSVADYALPAGVPLGEFPNAAPPIGSGLKGAYGRSLTRTIPYETLAYSTGRTLLESLEFFETHVREAPYDPEPNAVPHYAAISDRAFAGFVADCARLLKQVDGLQITGCNQGNYDTHGNQVTAFPRLLRDLGAALTALYFDLKPIWNDVLIVTLTEFGRTSLQNANGGTDHGEAACLFALGGGVRGGVYNCSPDRWENGDLFSTANGRYLAHRTDFRAVYHEILTQHLGDPASRIGEIIPGYGRLAADDRDGYFAPLGFLA